MPFNRFFALLRQVFNRYFGHYFERYFKPYEKDRIGFFIGLLLCFGVLCGIAFTPLQIWWELAFENMMLYEALPLIVLICVCLFTGSGLIRHTKTGRPANVPMTCLIVALLLFVLCFRLINEWSIDWTAIWAVMALLYFIAASAVAVWGCVAFGEWWRILLNRDVVAHVRKLIERPGMETLSVFSDRIRKQRSLGGRFGARVWGSPHCLLILEAELRDTREALLEGTDRIKYGLGSTEDHRLFFNYLHAAEAMSFYLDMNFPDNMPDPIGSALGQAARPFGEVRDPLRLNYFAEAITIVLWFTRCVLPEISQNSSTDQELFDRIKNRSECLINDFQTSPPEPVEYSRFLALIWQNTLCGEQPSGQVALIKSVYEAFNHLPTTEDNAGLKLSCSFIYLALGRTFLKPEICRDLWMKVHGGSNITFRLLEYNCTETAVATLARISLAMIYHELGKQLPDEYWNKPVAGVGNTIENVAEERPQTDTNSEILLDHSRNTASWPYPEVFDTPAVTDSMTTITFIAGWLAALFVIAANPEIPGPNPGYEWNAIDAVADRRPFHDYTRGTITDLAGSEHWLGLATATKGLMLMNKNSRLMREDVVDGPVLASAKGFGTDSFLALKDDQSLVSLEPDEPGDPPTNFNQWLETPKEPLWLMEGPLTTSDIIATAADRAGWLMVARGGIPARYRFASTQDGGRMRTRSWDLPQLIEPDSISVEHAAIGRDVLWYANEGGGLGCFDRSSLRELLDCRQKSTSPIVTLDSGYEHTWAVALDQRKRVWFSDNPNNGWRGPLFGLDEGGPIIASVSSIKEARLQNDLAWLVTDNRLFAYDQRQRRIRTVFDSPAAIDFVALDYPRALVAGQHGLAEIQFKFDIENRPFETNAAWEEHSITGFAVSPDHQFAVYQFSRTEGGDEHGGEVRIRHIGTSDQPKIATLIPATGWKQTPQPVIKGIQEVGKQLLFATNTGAFLYDPARRVYTDISAAIRNNKDPKEKPISWTVHEFNHLSQCNQLLCLSVGDGTALRKEKDQPWLDLDPYNITNPTHIFESNSSSSNDDAEKQEPDIFGIDATGVIHKYDYLGRQAPKNFLNGHSSLSSYIAVTTEPNNLFKGDLVLNENRNLKKVDWEMALLSGTNQVIHYNSENGEMKETSYTGLQTEGNELIQFRLNADDQRLLVLNRDGRIRRFMTRTTPEIIFGNGELPFSPATITALAPDSLDQDRILIGGHSSRLFEYQWQAGSWNSLEFPDVGSDVSVVEIEKFDGMWARLTDNRVFFKPRNSNEPWRVLSGVRRWAHSKFACDVWLLTDENVVNIQSNLVGLDTDTKHRIFSQGEGMENFLQQAVFVWQMTPTQVGIFSGRDEVGIYDAMSDHWRIRSVSDLHHPSQFVPMSDFLLGVDDNRIFRIDSEFSIKPILTLPNGARAVSLQVYGDTVRIAFMHNGAIHVWDKLDITGQKSPIKYQYGFRLSPDQFDPTRVIHGWRTGEKQYTFIDENGACARYDVSSDNWHFVYSPLQQDAFHGWIVDTNTETIVLLFNSTDSTPFKAVIVSATGEGLIPNGKELSDFLNIRSQQIESELVVPDKGVLPDNTEIRVFRENERTQYEVFRIGDWKQLNFHVGSAPNIDALGFYQTPSGGLWVLESERLLQMRPSTKTHGLELTGAILELGSRAESIRPIVTGEALLERSDEPAILITEYQSNMLQTADGTSHAFASIQFGKHHLQFIWRQQGGFQPRWDGNDSRPVLWSPDGNRLAIRTIKDIAVDEGEHLLISTQAGIIVRRTKDYAIEQYFPSLSNARFFQLYGPTNQLALRLPNGEIYVWQNANLSRIGEMARSESLSSELQTGPWRWHYSLDAAGITGLNLTYETSQQERRWQNDSNGAYRFADDIVNWIVRNPSDQSLWLATEDGLWPYRSYLRTNKNEKLVGISVRRVRSNLQGLWRWQDQNGDWATLTMGSDLSSNCEDSNVSCLCEANNDEYCVKTPALRVSFVDGWVTIRPFDGDDKPAFVEGRLFSDYGIQGVGIGGSIYTIVPQRALIRRDGKNPATVTGAWSLPQNESEFDQTIFEPTDRGLRLETLSNQNQPNNRVAWLFDLESYSWRPVEPRATWANLQNGLITWSRGSEHEHSYQPHLINQSALGHWWYEDRFAWDYIHNVAVLDEQRVVLLSDLGPVVTGLDGGVQAIFHAPEISICKTGRNPNYQPVGLVCGTENNRLTKLLTTNDDRSLLFSDIGSSGVQYYQKQLVFDDLVNKRNDRRLGFKERWVDSDAKVLDSEVEGLPSDQLLRDGQFIFDRVQLAAPILSSGNGQSTGQRQWITASACDIPLGELCWLMLYELSDQNGLFATVLRDLVPVGYKFDALRSQYNEFFGVHRNYDAWLVEQGRIQQQQISEINPSVTNVDALFRVGDGLHIDVQSLRFTETPRYHWDTRRTLVVTPSDYSLFAYKKLGNAFAFDLLTSVAVDFNNNLFLGSRGGLFKTPYNDGSIGLLRSPLAPNANFYIRQKVGGEWLANINRLRQDFSNKLWVQLSVENNPTWMKWHSDPSRWVWETTDWPTELKSAGGICVEMNGMGFKFIKKQMGRSGCLNGDNGFTQSRDAWGYGRKPIENIQGFAIDRDGKTAWIASKDNGVFKAFLQELKRH